MATPLFSVVPQPGESNLHFGLRRGAAQVGNAVLSPFQPGGRLDIGFYNPLMRGTAPGFLDPNVPGSFANEGWSIVNRLFGGSGDGAGDYNKAMSYAVAPATGPAAPETPPGAKPFSKPSQLPVAARGVRNNNFLNLTLSPFTESQPGFAGSDAGGRYAVFKTPEQGQAAAEKLLGSYLRRGYDTPNEIIGRWAPASENGNASTSNYAAYVASGLGIGPNDKVTPQQIPFLAQRMAEFENGARSGPNMSAFHNAADAVGLNAPAPQFDASGYQQARQIFGQIAANQMQPISATYADVPQPEAPTPDALQAPDYSAGDKELAAAQPKNPFGATAEEQASGQLKLRRGDYFAGMAQALSSIDWSRGVGLGELFAKMGAGALMGAKAGDREVQDKMDAFDKAMQQYHLAVANRNDTKAREATNIANQNIQAINQKKRDDWTVRLQEWQKDQPQIIDGVLRTKTKNPDGTVTETHTPLDPARKTAALMAQAQTAIGEANAKNEFSWQTYRANRELAGAAMPYAMADAASSGNLQGRDGIAAVGLSEAANAVAATGQWADLYAHYFPSFTGPDGKTHDVAADTRAAAYAAAGVQQGTNPTEAQMQVINDYISSKVLQDFVNAGKSWVLIGGPAHNPKLGNLKMNPDSAVTSSVSTQREQQRKTTRSVNAKGQVTTTERY